MNLCSAHKISIQQKENCKYNAGHAVSGHKSKIHAAQVVWFYQQMLIDEHGAEKNNPNIVQWAYVCKKYWHYNESGGKHMQESRQS